MASVTLVTACTAGAWRLAVRSAAAAAVDSAFASGTELAEHGLGVDGEDLEGRGEGARNNSVFEPLGAVRACRASAHAATT